MCAIRCISNRLCGEWKLKRASGHQWKQIKYIVIVAHKGKNNTSFGTVKGLFLFVCTDNIKKTLCFSKIKKTNRMRLSSRSWTGALHKNEPKLSEYFPYRHDEYIYRKLWITTKRNNSYPKQKLFHYNPYDAFLSKGASNEEMASQDF